MEKRCKLWFYTAFFYVKIRIDFCSKVRIEKGTVAIEMLRNSPFKSKEYHIKEDKVWHQIDLVADKEMCQVRENQ